MNIFKKIKNTLKKIYLYFTLGRWVFVINAKPMDSQKKYEIILSFQDKFKIKNFIETGTYIGDAVEACRQKFVYLYSIELEENLFLQSKERFKEYTHIEILHGDSNSLLPELLPKIEGSVLFWLDGHYSGGTTAKGFLNTPILAEIKSIFNSGIKKYCILIDDARCFTGLLDYPRINVLERLVKNYNENLNFEVENDIIRIYPKT